IVRQLCQSGFRHITMAVNHQANIIKAFFQGGEAWDATIDYSMESQPLSTIAPLTMIEDLPEHFLLMTGDVLTDLNLRAFLDEHAAEKRLFTIAATQRTQTADYGVLHVDDAMMLSGFEEKPTSAYFVSMGVYAVNRAILDLVPRGQKYGFD